MRCTARDDDISDSWRFVAMAMTGLYVCLRWVYGICVYVSYILLHTRETRGYVHLYGNVIVIQNSTPTIICISNLLPFFVLFFFKHMMPRAICKWWHFPWSSNRAEKRIILHIRWFVTRPFGMRCGTIAVWSLSLVYYQRTNATNEQRTTKGEEK